jgi:hypothetical protein
MSKFLRSFGLVVICYAAFLASAQGQTAIVIPANEAAAHISEWATVEGVAAKVFTSKSGNTFLNIGGAYPNQTFTGWIPPAKARAKEGSSTVCRSNDGFECQGAI